MTYSQPPVTPEYTAQPPQGDWTPPKPKSRIVPILAGVAVLLALAVAGLGYALLRDSGGDEPTAAAASPATAFAQIRDGCGVVSGYSIEDGGATLIMTVGGAFMSTGGMDCVFDRLGVPTAVREHVATTRALDGQQTDSWSGYTARWTYHPDNGLQMTIRTA